MDGTDGVPEWVPERPPRAGGAPRQVVRGASDPGGEPVPHHRAEPGAHARREGPPPYGVPRRGPLLGPLAAATGLVIVVGLGVYALAGGGGCAGGGTVTVHVAAAPEIAPAVSRAAGRFNDARREVEGRCARAVVRPTDPLAVTTLLSGRGVAGVTRRPDVWIPDSSMWSGLAESAPKSTVKGRLTSGRPVAASPVVVAMPRSLAARLRAGGMPDDPSWLDLLKAASGSGSTAIPPGLVRIQVPDPDRTATGMAALSMAAALPRGEPGQDGGDATFTGVVRTLRESVSPSTGAVFASFRRDGQGRQPVALVPEQAVFGHNAKGPAEPAVAVYPSDGTFSLDYPIVQVGNDPLKAEAGRALEAELVGDETGRDVRDLGFRTPDGRASGRFGARTGLDPRAPKVLPAPKPETVRRTMQAWARLSLSIRMLSVIDVSGSMEEEVATGVTRLQSTVRSAQGGLALLPDDSELGQWVFSTDLEPGRDWRELVSLGPLGERLGSSTRRQRVLSAFARIRAKENGDTGLYDTILAAYRMMKRSYKAEFVNSILLWTDGRNDDRGGPSLEATLDALRAEVDPTRPILVFMYGYGPGVDAAALRKIARVTKGDVLVARSPEEVQTNFLKAISRRVCTPEC